MRFPATLALFVFLLMSCAKDSQQTTFDCTPYEVIGYSQGESFPITIVTVDESPVEKMTANAYLIMQQAAASDAVRLHISNGFRTNDEQTYFYNCYLNCNCNDCHFALAPGFSEHQSGHALDLNTSEDGVLEWLNAHAAAFGFKRTIASEPWHWEWWGDSLSKSLC